MVSTVLTKRKVFTKSRYDLTLSYQFFVPDRKHFCLCIYPSLAIWFPLNGLFRMIQFSACPVWVSIGRVELQLVSQQVRGGWWGGGGSLRGVAAFRPFSMLVIWWWRAWSPPAKVPRLKGSVEAIDTWAPFISSTCCHITRLEESKLFWFAKRRHILGIHFWSWCWRPLVSRRYINDDD